MKTVLLTGITGFLGSHTAIQLLNKGYKVIGTLRDESRIESIKSVIDEYADISNLDIVVANLLNIEIWDQIIKDVDYVQHIASPFPRVLPKNPAELIEPAKEGTLAVLKAAKMNRVSRVVLTSSTGAITYGKEKGAESKTYSETDWTDPENLKDTTPYFRSKTYAEKAAWEFIESDKSGLELSVVCPGAILGPVLEKDFGTSANIVIKMIDGSNPAIPKIGFDCVDVRSVADLLILAMEKPEAANQRFIGANGFLSFAKVADILRVEYPNMKIPKAILPNFMTRFIANFDTTIKPILIDLGKERKVDNTKAKTLLGWKPLDNKEAVLSCAKSVIQLGIVKLLNPLQFTFSDQLKPIINQLLK